MTENSSRNLAIQLRKKRYAAERRFRLYGIISISIALGALCLLIGNMAAKGWSAFMQTYIILEVELPRDGLAPGGKIDIETYGRQTMSPICANPSATTSRASHHAAITGHSIS